MNRFRIEGVQYFSAVKQSMSDGFAFMLFSRLLPLIIGGVTTAVLIGCSSEQTGWPDKPGLKVVASFPPIACFAMNVAGPEGTVKAASTSQGVHHFDPKLSEIRLVSHADLLLINGLGLDERPTEKMQKGSGNKRIKIVPLGNRIDEKLLEEGTCDHDHDGGEAHHDHGHDPHVWMGINHAITMVQGIAETYKEHDTGKAAEYDQRAKLYTEKLLKLQSEGLEVLKDKKDRKILAFHSSLTYFAKTFNIKIADVIQQSPGREPTGKQLEALVAACVVNKVRVIAVEPQYSGQNAAKRILEELKRRGVEDPVMIELDPLETADEKDLNAEWYEVKMRANIQALAKVLK